MRPTTGILILILVVGLAGCGDRNKAKPAAGPATPPVSTENGRVQRDRLFQAHLAAARRLVLDQRLGDAEKELQGALELNSDNLEVHRGLAMILSVEGRRREAERHLFETVRQKQFVLQDLVLLAAPEIPYDEPDLINAALAKVPTDATPLLGRVRMILRSGQDREALELVSRITKQRPELMEAQALAGSLMLDLGTPESDFITWHDSLPKSANDSAEIWFVRGRWALAQQNHESAARCFWEAVRRDANHRQANYRLGLVLNALQRPQQSRPFLQRAQQLADLKETVQPVFTEGPSIDAVRRAAELTQALGRLWESRAWLIVGMNTADDARKGAFQQRLNEVDGMLAGADTPRTLPTANPARGIDLAAYAVPKVFADRSPTGLNAAVAPPAVVRFVDRAESAGLRFEYLNSATLAGREIRIFESAGGGVAVLDYDRDGWPDIYFTQCCAWPPDPTQRADADRLFRNLGNGRYADVTAQAGIEETGYSQGVTVGDYNNDGFPDLYIANIGQNRLYRNNGDGTFQLAKSQPDMTSRWTTSCVMADFDGDGWPDLYDVNYLSGREPFERICEQGGRRVACGPSLFPGEQDCLYRNLGDGTWSEVSSQVVATPLRGKGLGVVAADFDGSGRLSLFVANDAVANSFLLNRQSVRGEAMQFEDQALLMGLAFDRDGRNQACMGVAIDDANGDGLLDLFVTNYYDDYNTLYLQTASGFFEDQTRRSGLREPSLKLLGFGTQFLDADLDGRPDVVVGNGHVDDLSFEGKPYRMRPQFFRNAGQGRFVEQRDADCGPYFSSEYLNRGVARVDWNRDGREDFVTSQIGGPAALATNESPGPGQALILKLAARHSARDAIGAQVQVDTGDGPRVRQLTAGDGFQASNQRQLVFGLGGATRAKQVQITWPSGAVERFHDVAAGIEWIAVEGHESLETCPLR